MIALALSTPRIPGDADLPLGAPSGGGSFPTCYLTGSAPPPARLSCTGTLRTVTLASGSAPEPARQAPTGRLIWHHNTFRGAAGIASTAWQIADRIRAADVLPWVQSAQQRSPAADRWQTAGRRCGVGNITLGSMDCSRAPARAAWDRADPARHAATADYANGLRQRLPRRLPWAESQPRRHAVAGAFEYPARRRWPVTSPWHDGRGAAQSLAGAWQPSRPLYDDGVIPWQAGRRPPHRWPPVSPGAPPPAADCRHPHRTLLALVVLRTAGDATLPLVCYLHLPPPAGHETVVVPFRRVYLMLHDVIVTRLSDNQAIDCSGVSLSLDADSHTWGARLTLLGNAARDAVEPSALGEPVALAIAIDGHVWHVLAESCHESRAFGKRAIDVQARGLSAELLTPYRRLPAGRTVQNRTVQQALSDLLPIDAGFAIAWHSGTPDWLLPAGSFGWGDTSPLAAIHAACQSVGLIVRPGMAHRALTVMPRYPVLPWATATPDVIIPGSVLIDLARQTVTPDQANAVYVHGTDASGILARVRRTGSAADRLADTVSADLITHTDAARLLGSRLLAKHASPPAIRSATLPLGGDVPLINVGDYVRVETTAVTATAVVSSVSIEARRERDALTVRQKITFGEDTPNAWARFRELLPTSPRLYASVLSSAAGSSLVQPLTGGTVRAAGSAPPGTAVWVRDHLILGAAPAMVAGEVEV